MEPVWGVSAVTGMLLGGRFTDELGPVTGMLLGGDP